MTEEGNLSPGQAAMTRPVSSKLSPVENTVAPGNRKHKRQDGHGKNKHFRLYFHNKAGSSLKIKYLFRFKYSI